jgi:hypothetical protein
MARKEVMAYPLLGFQVAKNPQRPTLAVVMFHTERGTDAYAAYREILEQIAESFLRVAATLPRKSELQ